MRGEESDIIKNMKGDGGRSKFYTLEKIIKGASNHRRVEILYLLKEKPNLSVFDISEKLKCNFKTISEHTRRLVQSGLISKYSDGSSVRHEITLLGENVLKFLRTLE